jgi:hypothetical protein
MKAATLRYCACRCALCVETLTSCIALTQNWSMQIIGPGWALILNSTPSFRSILNTHAKFVTLTLHPLTSQCVRRTCHITAAHTSTAQPQLRVPMPRHCTSDITTSTGWGHTHLENVPVHIGDSARLVNPPQSRPLLNSELVLYACQAMHYDWAVYSFSNGHFSSLIKSHGLPFTICLACDTSKAGRSLFNEFVPKVSVFSSGNDLLNHIRASGHQSVISGYLINSHHFQTSKIASLFWKLQLLIAVQLRLIRLLSIVVAIMILDHDRRAVKSFIKGLEAAHW